MQVQTCETHIDENEERLALEHAYKSLDKSLGHPAGDTEICDEMKITLDEFHQMLDRMKGLNIGRFQKMAPRDGDTTNKTNEPLIRYIPDASKTDSSFVFRPSEIREMLTEAIETLPKMERLIVSLYYYDELTLKEIEAVLGIHRVHISQLYTRAVLRLRSKLSRAADNRLAMNA
jgi:RNA polymerase sigma factor for flagellar operon FliA